MHDAQATFDAPLEALAVEGAIDPGFAGSFRIVVRAPSHHAETETLWFAVYGPEATQNGWDPMDQTRPAAYMPVRLAQLEPVSLGSSGRFTLLRNRSAVRLAGDVRAQMRALLARLDLDAQEIESCLGYLS